MREQVFMPGRYRHYKGNYYELLLLAKNSETLEDMVIYRALYGDGGYWARPAFMWNEFVTDRFPPVRRFTFAGGGGAPEGLAIRTEEPGEYREICDFVENAFATAAVADGTEQDLVAGIRNGEAYVPELSLVAKCCGETVGHIMLSKARTAGKPDAGLLIAAPLSVRLDMRGRGVGGALMREALNRARKLGFAGVILLGDPGYYRRFGFESAKKKGLALKQESVPEECFMALQLFSDWPDALQGEIDLENPY